MKKLLIFLYLCSTNLFSQTTFNVQDNFGYKYLELTNVLPTDSCYYVTGVITDTTGQQNQFGSLFLKFSLTGDTLLTKKLVLPSKRYLTWNTGLLADTDGNLVTAGESLDSIGKVFFLKYTPEGDTLFIKEYLSPTHPLDDLISADALTMYDGGHYLAGFFLPSPDNIQVDIAVFKLDQAGTLVQQKIYGTGMNELPGSMILDGNGGLVIGANRSNTNTNLQNFKYRTYIFGVDSLGSLQWEYLSPQGQLQDIAHSMVRTPDGGLVVASGRGIEGSDSPGVGFLSWQSYIFKLNANHQLVWGREMRGSRYSGNRIVKVVTATDGAGFVACGNVVESQSFGEEKQGSWVVKVSNQGDSLWARYYTFVEGVEKYYEPVDFKATLDGGYIVAGKFQDGQKSLGWLMKLDLFGCLVPGCNANDGPNATGEAQKAGLRLAIYPNPTADFLNFYVASPFPITIGTPKEGAQFRILNEAGQVVREFRASTPGDTFIVPVRDWAAGVYFLQYMVEGRAVATERFVVQGR